MSDLEDALAALTGAATAQSKTADETAATAAFTSSQINSATNTMLDTVDDARTATANKEAADVAAANKMANHLSAVSTAADLQQQQIDIGKRLRVAVDTQQQIDDTLNKDRPNPLLHPIDWLSTVMAQHSAAEKQPKIQATLQDLNNQNSSYNALIVATANSDKIIAAADTATTDAQMQAANSNLQIGQARIAAVTEGANAVNNAGQAANSAAATNTQAKGAILTGTLQLANEKRERETQQMRKQQFAEQHRNDSLDTAIKQEQLLRIRTDNEQNFAVQAYKDNWQNKFTQDYKMSQPEAFELANNPKAIEYTRQIEAGAGDVANYSDPLYARIAKAYTNRAAGAPMVPQILQAVSDASVVTKDTPNGPQIVKGLSNPLVNLNRINDTSYSKEELNNPDSIVRNKDGSINYVQTNAKHEKNPIFLKQADGSYEAKNPVFGGLDPSTGTITSTAKQLQSYAKNAVYNAADPQVHAFTQNSVGLQQKFGNTPVWKAYQNLSLMNRELNSKDFAQIIDPAKGITAQHVFDLMTGIASNAQMQLPLGVAGINVSQVAPMVPITTYQVARNGWTSDVELQPVETVLKSPDQLIRILQTVRQQQQMQKAISAYSANGLNRQQSKDLFETQKRESQ